MSLFRKTHLASLMFTVALWYGSSAMAQTILRVDSSASTGGDGESWGTAFRYLQDAIDFVATADPVPSETDPYEIWVKAGQYFPDESEYTQRTAGDRTESFHLHDFVALYGGFEGGETSLGQRDWVANDTILSGDLSGDDNLTEFLAGDYDTYDDNSYHVSYGEDIGPSAILDGFTIRGGNAYGGQNDDFGGGLLNESSNGETSPTISNCRFHANLAKLGGGIGNRHQVNMLLTNCEFSRNVAEIGGGIVNYEDCEPVIAKCSFTENIATDSGGGAYNRGPCNVLFVNCTFASNSAEAGGGDFTTRHYGVASAEFTNCTFTLNSAEKGAGVRFEQPDCEINIVNCTFVENDADDGSAAYGLTDAEAHLKNCIVWANSGDDLSAEFGATIDAEYSDIEGGYSGTGNINAYPDFVDAPNGNFRLESTSPCRDTGHSADVPADEFDVDDDSDANEATPDLDLATRIIRAAVDMGAYEFQVDCTETDLNGDCTVDGEDMADVLADWTGDSTYPNCPPYLDTDFTKDCKVNGLDLGILLAQWGPCNGECGGESLMGGGESSSGGTSYSPDLETIAWLIEASIQELWTWWAETFGGD